MKIWKKLIQLVGILVGIAIIIAGVNLMNNVPSPVSIDTEYAISYSFGADFYTEMYGVTYDILSQLKNISRGLTSNFGRMLSAMYEVVSALIITLGTIITAAFGYLFLSDFTVGKKKDKQAAQEQPTESETAATVDASAVEAVEETPAETDTTIEA